MKNKRKIFLVFTILMILVLVISSACDVVKPDKEEEAQELLDEMFPESEGDNSGVAGESETGDGETTGEGGEGDSTEGETGEGGEGEADEPEKKVSFVDLHDGDMKLASVDWMLESLYPAVMNDDRAKVVFFYDEKGGWKYSILDETPGVQIAQNDIYGWGYWRAEAYPGWSGPPPDEIFPCDGDQTICAQDRPNNPWGNYHVVYTVHDGPVSWQDPTYFHSHSLALDTDGVPDNNFPYNDPYDGDYYRDTDRQYDAWYDLNTGQWGMDAMGQNFALFPTDARVVINDNVVFLIIPTGDFPIQAPTARVTTFLTTGGYDPENCGYDTNGEDPTDNLTPLSADPIYLLDQEALLVSLSLGGTHTLLGPGGCICVENRYEGQKVKVQCDELSTACSSRGGKCTLFRRALGDPPQDPDSWHYVGEGDKPLQKDLNYDYNCFCVN